MAIIFDSKAKTISLHTAHSTWQMAISRYNYLLHLYYGARIDCDMSYLLEYSDRAFAGNPADAKDDRTFSLDVLPQEYPSYGTGDFRIFSLNVRTADGVYGCDLRYVSHNIKKGKYTIPGLPSVRADDSEAETLEIILEDACLPLRVILRYGVLENLDVITRCAEIVNTGDAKIFVTKANSACLDLLSGDYDLIHFPGRHGMERNPERAPILHEAQSFGSLRGTSSHQQNPFFILAERGADENKGSCYGLQLLYSGNFKGEVEKEQFGSVRACLGLQDEMFAWPLAPDESFCTPEAALAYTNKGLTALSHIYHEMIRYHICQGKYQNIRRPILLNSWEATYFDFDGDKIIDIAREAKSLGVETLVLDDGWFLSRYSDTAGLGDWVVDTKKLGCNLSDISEAVHNMGMNFGLWIEPEMVNENSDLYRQHPDWAFKVPGRSPVSGRGQLVLDFSRGEIVDAIFESIAKIIEDAGIDYIKMDMNRSVCDVYSAKYRDTPDNQNYGKITHEYILGLYAFLERFNERFPDLLLEGCSGGGGRYDAGMMYYEPQIWLSDDTDAVERINIQYGSSFGYPISTVGSHVSAVPNHQTGRRAPINTRAVVAMAGSFGYELDPRILSSAEKEEVKEQIETYKKYWPLIHNGLYYRLTAPDKNREAAAWLFAAKDKSEALLNIVTLNTHCNAPRVFIKCEGLDPEAKYRDEESGFIYSGSALMEVGVPIPIIPDEYNAWQIHFTRLNIF